jgi:formate/nitrite transporter FocA (FNT family)
VFKSSLLRAGHVPDLMEAKMGMGLGIIVAAYIGGQLMTLPSHMAVSGGKIEWERYAAALGRAAAGAICGAALFMIIGQQAVGLGTAAVLIAAAAAGALGAAFAFGVRRLGSPPAAQRDQ